jgi:hypothetical protein
MPVLTFFGLFCPKNRFLEQYWPVLNFTSFPSPLKLIWLLPLAASDEVPTSGSRTKKFALSAFQSTATIRAKEANLGFDLRTQLASFSQYWKILARLVR